MGEAALREVTEGAVLLPPDFRMSNLLQLVDDVNGVEAQIEAGEQAHLAWRQRADDLLYAFRDAVEKAATDLSPDVAHAILSTNLKDRMDQLRDLIAELEDQPLMKSPRARGVLKKVRGNPLVASYMNRMFVRVDRIRLEYIADYTRYFYELAALMAAYDPEATPTGEAISSPEQLDDFFARLAG